MFCDSFCRGCYSLSTCYILLSPAASHSLLQYLAYILMTLGHSLRAGGESLHTHAFPVFLIEKGNNDFHCAIFKVL